MTSRDLLIDEPAENSVAERCLELALRGWWCAGSAR